MHLIASFAIVALFTLNPLAAQFPTPQSASQPAGLQIQPFKLAAADFKAMLYRCQPTTTLADAEKQIQKNAESAFRDGSVKAVMAFLSAAEGPEGRPISEFIPVLFSNLRRPAEIAHLNETQTGVFKGLGYRADDRFEICTPRFGPTDLTVLRPVSVPGQSALANAAAQVSMLPTFSTYDFSNLSQTRLAAKAWLESVQLPTCDPDAQPGVTSSLFSSLSGTVSAVGEHRGFTVGKPRASLVQGAQVDLIGPTPASCRTPESGGFLFRNLLAGYYTLRVSQAKYQSSEYSLTLMVQRDQSLRVELRPIE
jgi:hypothetical protein